MIAIEHTILISNLLVTIALFIVTAYRIKIEKEQISVIIKNAEAAEKIERLRKLLKTEKESFGEMTEEEFIEFLKEFAKRAD